MLTVYEIRLLLSWCADETVQGPTAKFPFRIVRRGTGWSDDPSRAALQGKLSIMLELAERGAQ